MTAVTADWFVGSFTLATAINFTVDGNNASIAAGNYYLRHVTGARSLLSLFATACVAAVGGTCTVTIRRNRKVHVVFNVARTVDFVDGTIDGLLGMNNSPYGPSTTMDADSVSPMLWSPGYPGTTETIRGVDGYESRHQAIYESDDGQQSYTYDFGSETWQDVSWTHIVPERMRVATGNGGGTFHQFFRQCGQLGARFFVYQDVIEDDADSTTDVTWTTGRGPYVLRPESRRGDWWKRNEAFTDFSLNHSLAMHQVAEYP